MKQLASELLRYSSDILRLNSKVNEDYIINFERKYNLNLPLDFKLFISNLNGFSFSIITVYGFDPANPLSIENIYHNEHFEVILPQYIHLVPFSDDGGGNFYCMDTKNKDSFGNCKIVFWASNYQYTDMDEPEVTHSSFTEWLLDEVIEWAKTNYEYDGRAK
jgi:SMI1-KNR4 cell-wall